MSVQKFIFEFSFRNISISTVHDSHIILYLLIIEKSLYNAYISRAETEFFINWDLISPIASVNYLFIIKEIKKT